MWTLIAFVASGVFLFGLIQWARGGANLWQIFKIHRRTRSGDLSLTEYHQAENEVRQLERSADRTLSMSFRVLGWLAVIVWAFLGVSLVAESFGVDLIGEISSRAVIYWSTTNNTVQRSATPDRDNILRNLGNNLRK